MNTFCDRPKFDRDLFGLQSLLNLAFQLLLPDVNGDQLLIHSSVIKIDQMIIVNCLYRSLVNLSQMLNIVYIIWMLIVF